MSGTTPRSPYYAAKHCSHVIVTRECSALWGEPERATEVKHCSHVVVINQLIVAVAGYRKALVNAIVLLSCTNGPRKLSFRLVVAPFLTFWAAFSPEERSLVDFL